MSAQISVLLCEFDAVVSPRGAHRAVSLVLLNVNDVVHHLLHLAHDTLVLRLELAPDGSDTHGPHNGALVATG